MRLSVYGQLLEIGLLAEFSREKEKTERQRNKRRVKTNIKIQQRGETKVLAETEGLGETGVETEV
jgi:hypothetical protein